MAASSMDMLEDRKRAPIDLGDVLILGLGKSGRIAARYCLDLLGTRVRSVAIAAGARNDDAESFARTCTEAGALVAFDRTHIEGTYDLCIVSPGISQFSDFYRSAQAAAHEVVSEVEFAWRESRAESRWVAITGTNGKTTTTALCAHLLQACGMRATAVGNIGDTCLEAVIADATDVYVAETSSYQLASTVDFAPNVAVMLNITPDHIKWHKTHEAYVAAKCKVMANLGTVAGSVAVLDAVNDEVRQQVRALRGYSDEQRGFAYIPIGAQPGLTCDMRARCGSRNAAFVRADDRMLMVSFAGVDHELCRADELLIPGEHNVGNALAAASAAIALGGDADAVRSGLVTFTSLEHRIEACGQVDGVACYNDSKATNVDATLKALAAFDPKKPIVLLGGDDKFTSLDELVAAAEVHCKAVVCFGAAGARFLQAFSQAKLPVYEAGRMEEALDCALSHAQSGDIVLLSPACASFDEFSCFEERGEVFKDLVARRAAG
jgi:UDP-N-acetylmuramoylalanine--D-glutamate ligase